MRRVALACGWIALAAAPLLLAVPAKLLAPITLAQDEGIPLAGASLLLEGRWPNSDFMSLYGVNNVLLVAGPFWVFGPSLLVERLVGLLTRLVIVATASDLARRAGGRWVGVAAGWASSIAVVYGGLGAFSWTNGVALAMLATWFAVVLGERTPKLAVLVPWLLCGLAAGVRLDLLPACAAAVAVGRHLGPVRRSVGLGIAGFAIGVAPVALQLALASHAVGDLVVAPGRIAPGRRLSISDASVTNKVMLGVVIVGLVAVALVLWDRRADRSSTGYRSVAVLGTFSALILHQMLQRYEWLHLSYVVLAVGPATIAAIGYGWRGSDGEVRWSRPVRIAAAGFLAVAAVAFLRGSAVEGREVARDTVALALHGPDDIAAEVHGGGRTVLVPTEDAPDLQSAVDAISSMRAPGCDAVVTGPEDLRYAYESDTFLYFLLSDLEPGTRHIEFSPGFTNASDSGLADDLEEADLLLLRGDTENRESNASADPGDPRPGRVVAERFEEVGRWGPWRVLAGPDCR